MEKHKQLLDKEYEQLLTQFSKVTIFTLINDSMLDCCLVTMNIVSIKEENIGMEVGRSVARVFVSLEHGLTYLCSRPKKWHFLLFVRNWRRCSWSTRRSWARGSRWTSTLRRSWSRRSRRWIVTSFQLDVNFTCWNKTAWCVCWESIKTAFVPGPWDWTQNLRDKDEGRVQAEEGEVEEGDGVTGDPKKSAKPRWGRAPPLSQPLFPGIRLLVSCASAFFVALLLLLLLSGFLVKAEINISLRISTGSLLT